MLSVCFLFRDLAVQGLAVSTVLFCKTPSIYSCKSRFFKENLLNFKGNFKLLTNCLHLQLITASVPPKQLQNFTERM